MDPATPARSPRLKLLLRKWLERLREADAKFRKRTNLALWMPAGVAVVFWALLYSDPFGFEGEAEAGSARATQRIASPFYRPSDEVVAVVIDDDYLFARQSGWPLRYAEQGAILRRILDFEPAVVLVDFVYAHRHGAEEQREQDPLARLIQPLEDNSIPVIFTALAPHDTADRCAFGSDSRGVGKELLDVRSVDGELVSWIGKTAPGAAGPRQITLVNWSGCGDKYPLMLAGEVKAATPAFAAYRAFCSSRTEVAGCADAPSDEAGAAAFTRPMIVRAGAFPPLAQQFSHADVCQQGAREDGTVSLWRRVSKAARQLAFSFFGNPRRSDNVEISLPCPAVNVLPYSLLADATYEEWEDLLRGKLVVLGADISGIHDVVETPVHGQVAGAVWHAMAADNLLSSGKRYLRDPPEHAQRAIVLIFGLLFGYTYSLLRPIYSHDGLKQKFAWMSLAFWMAMIGIYVGAGQWPMAALALLLLIGTDLVRPTQAAVYSIALLSTAMISMLFLFWFDFPVGNWIGLSLLLLGSMHALKALYPRDPPKRRFPHPLSILARPFERKPS